MFRNLREMWAFRPALRSLGEDVGVGWMAEPFGSDVNRRTERPP